MQRAVLVLFALGLLGGCSVWDVNQDPAGMGYRRSANEIIMALQNYRRDKGEFPVTLGMLTPGYMPSLPEVPDIRYEPRDGSLRYAYTPSWPQLRPVRCVSEGNTTVWRCTEHILDKPL
ncbi:MAG TPA: hypothetical protein VHW69_00400 [Rhizomicrobium sp.]|jgi:hypothetical protein|nr:hypothetical protein [Rhizomicrobium sp.]